MATLFSGVKQLNIQGSHKAARGFVVILAVLFAAFTLVWFAFKEPLVNLGQEYYVSELNSVVDINSDGSITVTDDYTIVFKNRDKDWSNFYKEIGLYDSGTKHLSKISDMAVRDLDSGVDYTFYDKQFNPNTSSPNQTQIFYCVNTGANGGKEIGFYMPPFEKGTRRMRMQYTISDFVTQYSDTTQFYYKAFDKTIDFRTDKYSMQINYPQELSGLSDLRGWLHVENGLSNLDISRAQSASVTIDKLPKKHSVEVRLLIPNTAFSGVAKTVNTAKKAAIEAEEQGWYDAWQKEVLFYKTLTVVDIILALGFIGLCAPIILWGKKRNKRVDVLDVPEYTRDIPNDYSPAEIAPLLYYYEGSFKLFKARTDIISATILDLCRRKYLKLEQGEKEVTIEVNLSAEVDKLKKHEKILFDLLVQADSVKEGPMGMKEFEKYAKKNFESVAKKLDSFVDETEKKTAPMIPPQSYTGGLLTGAMLFLSIISAVLIVTAIAPLFWAFLGAIILIGAAAFVTLPKLRLEEKGQRQYLEFEGLKKFMLDFSDMNQKEVPELALWEEFLIYATAMGIADKVSKQLKVKYPQLSDPVYMQSHYPYAVFYMGAFNTRGFSGGIGAVSQSFSKVQSTVTNLVNAKNHGSGGGGGFGGGGFGGGGGGFGGGGGGAR